jgi:hypothetical protein
MSISTPTSSALAGATAADPDSIATVPARGTPESLKALSTAIGQCAGEYERRPAARFGRL